MLPNEVRMDWGLACRIGLGLFWRWLLIGALPGIAVQHLVRSAPMSGFALQLLISLVGLCLAAKWLFTTGRLGRLRIVFMDQAHYRDLAMHRSQSPQE